MKMHCAATFFAVLLSLFCLSVAVSTNEEFNNDTTVNLEGRPRKKKNKQYEELKLTHIPLKRATDANTGCFVGKIEVGTKSNTYEVYFDTLTSNSWMFGTSRLKTRYGRRFPGKITVLPRSPYDCATTSEKSVKRYCKRGGGFVETYPDGSSYAGGSVTDSIQIGSLKLPEFRMGLVNKKSTTAVIMRGKKFDGVVGLGPLGWSTHGLSSVLKGIEKAAKGIQVEQVATTFSFYVSEDMQSGEITFGGHNPKLLADDKKFGYTNTLTFAMVSNMFTHGEPVGKKLELEFVPRWAVLIDTMTINGNLVKSTDSLYMKALVDTSAPHGLIVPDEKYMEMLATSIGNGAKLAYDMELLIDCSKVKDLAPLVLKFDGDIEVTFEPHEYFPFQVDVDEKEVCASFFVLADRPYYGDGSFWGIGLRFIKKYYVEFKIEPSPKIGFGLSKGDAIPYDDKTDKKNK